MRNLSRGRRVINLRVSDRLHFLAKCVAIYESTTIEELYQQALRYYLVRECGSAIKPLIKEFDPALTPEELALIQSASDK